MLRCGIYCNFSEEFYKKFKRNKRNYYRFKENLTHITIDLIYSGNLIFSVGGTSEFYRDFMEEFFPCCSIIDKVFLEVINGENYIDYLINECDYIFVFWHDDKTWDKIMDRFDKANKDVDIFDMECVTDEYIEFEKKLKKIADEDKRIFLRQNHNEFIEFLMNRKKK